MIKFILIAVATFILSECILPQNPMTFRKEDHGKTVEIVVGDEFFISLEANPTTGFTWALTKMDTNLIEQVGDVSFNARSDLLGAPGIQTFTFTCLQTGTRLLEMIYHQPWDTKTAPADTFSLTLHITD